MVAPTGVDMSNKPKYDWPTIRREYSTAQFSDSELARRYGCSRAALQKRVKKEKWKRDNSAEVRRVAQARMIEEDASIAKGVAGGVADPHAEKKEKTEIELAAETRVAVLRDHRKDIRKMRELESEFLVELQNDAVKLYMCNFKGDIFSEEVGIPITEKSQALNNLATVQSKRITLERIAFNLDEDDSKDDSLPMVIVHDPSQVEEFNGNS